MSLTRGVASVRSSVRICEDTDACMICDKTVGFLRNSFQIVILQIAPEAYQCAFRQQLSLLT
jgi:hypothetical protein